MPAWTTPDDVAAALGPGAAPPLTDVWLIACCDAANAAAYRKRREAGYDDPDDAGAPAPTPDVKIGATLWAVSLWRQRQSVDSFTSFEDLSGFTPTGGSWGEIRRMLGIGRAAVDAPPDPDDPTAVMLRRRRARYWWRW